jgi:hypothetical protein
VTFTATVKSFTAGTPVGSVTFYDGTTKLGTAYLRRNCGLLHFDSIGCDAEHHGALCRQFGLRGQHVVDAETGRKRIEFRILKRLALQSVLSDQPGPESWCESALGRSRFRARLPKRRGVRAKPS